MIDSRIGSGTITGKINVAVLLIEELDCVCTLKFSFFMITQLVNYYGFVFSNLLYVNHKNLDFISILSISCFF